MKNIKDYKNSRENTMNTNLLSLHDAQLKIYAYVNFVKKKVIIFDGPKKEHVTEVLTFERFSKKYPMYKTILQ